MVYIYDKPFMLYSKAMIKKVCNHKKSQLSWL